MTAAAIANKPGLPPEDVPAVLLPYQQRWVADDAAVKIAEKSRRIGLTWAEAGDDVLIAAEANGDNVYYIGPTKDMAFEFIEACAWWCRSLGEAASEIQEGVMPDEDRDILTYTINFPSGRRIQALSSRPRNLRGKQGIIVIDEAAFHENLGELLKAALAMLIWGGKVRIISTHDGVANAFNELINDIRAGKKSYSLHRITFDEALADGLYKRICLVTGQTWTPKGEREWAAQIREHYAPNDAEELDCIPNQSSGRYLAMGLVEARAEQGIPVLRLDKPASFALQPVAHRQAEMAVWLAQEVKPLLEALDPRDEHVLGEDFARSGDSTEIVPLAISQNLQRRVPFVIELHNLPFDQQQQIIHYVLAGLPNLRAAGFDARGNGGQIAEAMADEFGHDVIEQIMATNVWYMENMPPMKAAFEDALITIPADRDIRDDLMQIRVIAGVPKVPENTGQKGRHGDFAIALCHAWRASQREPEVYAYEPVTSAESRERADRLHSVNITGGFGAGQGVW
ncbi:terminase large subunit domain-containing protein [Salinisphaera hydrothermalis]|uniref:terminase large subunit domain-containing protein n=1 Tax=Salinisphaera hydrothermalis TaxID=563188 RepID=UPI003342376E